jgi:hypothetical protein
MHSMVAGSEKKIKAFLEPSKEDERTIIENAIDMISDKEVKELLQKRVVSNITDSKSLTAGLPVPAAAAFNTAFNNQRRIWSQERQKSQEFADILRENQGHRQQIDRIIGQGGRISVELSRLMKAAGELPNLNSAAGRGSQIPSADEVGGAQGGGGVLTPRPTANYSDPERNIQNIAQAYAGMGGMIPRQPAIQNESLPAFRPLTGYPVLQSLSAIAEPQPAPQELPELNRSTVPHMASGAVESAILAPYRIRAEDSERIWANSAIPDHEKKNWQIKALMDVWRERAGRDSPKERAFTRDSLESLYGFSPFEPN